VANKNIDKAKGRAKEAAGAVSGNKRLKIEGRADQAKGSAKNAVDKVAKHTHRQQEALGTRTNAPRSISSCRSLGGGDHAHHPAYRDRSPVVHRGGFGYRRSHRS